MVGGPVGWRYERDRSRATESQVHREMASGLSCPVGFKNGTDAKGYVLQQIRCSRRHLWQHHPGRWDRVGDRLIVRCADDAVIAGLDLPGYILNDQRLVVCILAAVAMARIDHDGWSDASAVDREACRLDAGSIVVRHTSSGPSPMGQTA